MMPCAGPRPTERAAGTAASAPAELWSGVVRQSTPPVSAFPTLESGFLRARSSTSGGTDDAGVALGVGRALGDDHQDAGAGQADVTCAGARLVKGL